MARKLISCIIPIYNEENNILPLNAALEETVAPLRNLYNFEFIFVNDGSKDASAARLWSLAYQDETKKIISFTRNFGHQKALMAGYDHAQGDAIICLDADMQHPPSVVAQMIAAWEGGAVVVYARKISRQEGWLKAHISQIYYRFLETITDISMPPNVSDFRLIDRAVLLELRKFNDHSPYFRGMVPWTGFPHTFVDFHCDARLHGVSSYTWRKMFKLSFDGITGFSTFPLKIAAYIGCLVALTGMSMFAYITIDACIYQIHYPLFKWLVTIIYIFLGVQFILTWFLGEYIGRIYDQQRNRPRYVIHHTKNINLQPQPPANPSRPYVDTDHAANS